MLVSDPVVPCEFGPSTTAPLNTGEPPLSEPIKLANWCWMQSGKTVPSPTINEVPHAFAPKMLSSQRAECAACVLVPVSAVYSLAMTESPPPWLAVSSVAQDKPNPNGPFEPMLVALLSSFWKSASTLAWFTANPLGLPARPSARYNSYCARPVTS